MTNRSSWLISPYCAYVLHARNQPESEDRKVSDADYVARGRLDYIEQQLEALPPGRYVPFAAVAAVGMPPGVVELVRAGNTIAAIQEYRKATGAELAVAKRAVESIR
jgi:hypothetical protein